MNWTDQSINDIKR